ncbi:MULTISPECIES: TetR/AcrR family transcriptional regulator [Corynebacterium]|uniref:TetR/AcrR family transcriptional regulator n=1 Tax=Corynebacterium TaxID=1716 RepID=UPI00264DA691|nr:MULTISPECIES: TetR/AcrR family transcriptional regulator [Corynebacterium]MDN8625218.1 helix-turn-helix domain-containing protein [Corynebacterium kroppenstedtii]
MESTRNYLDIEGNHAPRGLRERKRLETLCAIEDHATRLVLENGYDNVTIEDIVDAANVSKRTFFNYVDSKETAVLGHPIVDIPDKEQREFLAADPRHVTVALVDLILQTSFASRGRSDEFSTLLLSRRKQIFRNNPDIAAPQFGLTVQRFHNIVELVDEFFTLHPERRSLPQTAFPSTENTDGVSEEAVALTILCQDAVRIGTLRWTRQPDATNGHRRLRDCCLGAFTLFYDVLGAPPPECLAGTTPPDSPGDTPRPSTSSSQTASSPKATSRRTTGHNTTTVDNHHKNDTTNDDERNDEKWEDEAQ